MSKLNKNISYLSVNHKLIEKYKNYLYKIEYKINNNKDYERTSINY